MFTALDRLLITTAVATTNDQLGGPTLDELCTLIDEIVHLNAQHQPSYFHAGFLAGLTGREIDVPDAGLNDDRREWLLFGRLVGLIRHDANKDALEEGLRSPASLERLLSDPSRGSTLVQPLVEAALVDHVSDAARLITWRHHPFPHLPATWGTVYERARQLLAERRATQAEELFAALQGWVDLRPSPADDRADLTRRQSACQRAHGSFSRFTRLLGSSRSPWSMIRADRSSRSAIPAPRVSSDRPEPE